MCIEWDYTIASPDGGTVAAVSRNRSAGRTPTFWTSPDPKDALYVLMFVLAIDAEKCSRN